MNLYPSRDDDPDAPLAPPEWTMAVDMEGASENAYYFAWVYSDGVQVCKLSLMGRAIASKEMARRALATKARLWIDDYLSRSHKGSTDIGDLSAEPFTGSANSSSTQDSSAAFAASYASN